MRYQENIFVRLGRVVKILKKAGRRETASQLIAAVMMANSYEEAVHLINSALVNHAADVTGVR
jgi:hypothetical protein